MHQLEGTIPHAFKPWSPTVLPFLALSFPFSSLEENMCWYCLRSRANISCCFPHRVLWHPPVPAFCHYLLNLLIVSLLRPLWLVGPCVSSIPLSMYPAACFLAGFSCLSEVKRKGRKLYKYKSTIVSYSCVTAPGMLSHVANIPRQLILCTHRV